jgi:8-oxo-dGTP pyrophosphatase MutT (NUDIX family)
MNRTRQPEQSGVIPYRIQNGEIEVLLVTSRSRKRWIIPKGNIEPELSSRQSASKEAYEEAGVKGRVHPVPFGSYEHDKSPRSRTIEVFLMEVETTLPRWPETDRRDRRWMSMREARDRVLEPGLKRLLSEMAELLY